MFAMVLSAPHTPLVAERRAQPEPGPGEVRLRILACGVCRTDLHVVDGDLPQVKPTIIPGHEIVGRVDAIGPDVTGAALGQRLGVAWLGETCGVCRYCREGEENLCDHPGFTGWTRDGGYADTVIARADYSFPIPDLYGDAEAAPLMCAGLIGYRSWRKACEGRAVRRLGLYGFGAAAHLLAQLAVWSGQEVYAFTRAGDAAAQALALELGCRWAGGSAETPPEPLDAAILFAPVGDLVPLALKAVRKGGIVVCGGIHMSDIPRFPYALLWEERRLVSVANLTRQDGREYLPLAARAGVRPQVTTYPLAQANAALEDLRRGAFAGAAVLVPPAPGGALSATTTLGNQRGREPERQMNELDGPQSGLEAQDATMEMEITMKKLVIAALAATTALTGVMSAGAAAAQPGYYGDHDRRDHDRRDHDRRHWDRDHRKWDRDHRGYERNWDRWYRHDRWSRGDHRYYGGRYGYDGYRGHWRSGERYPYWREDRYVIRDYRAYRLPPPRPGYRYYRDDNGDIVMVAIASGLIGLIIGSSLND